MNGSVPPSPTRPPLWTILLGCWVAMLFFAPLFHAPNTDDIFYFGPALGWINDGALGLRIRELLIPIYFNFPTYSVFQGLFFFLTDLVGLETTFATYHLFHSLIVGGLLGLSLYYIKVEHSDDLQGNRDRFAVFLTLLAITPFSLSWPLVRPEILGLLFFLGGTLLIRRRLGKGGSRPRRLFVMGLLFGLAIISHPTFAIVSAPVISVAIWFQWSARRRWGDLFWLAVGLGLPGLLLILYFLNGYPESLEELSNQTRNKASTGFSFLVLQQIVEKGLFFWSGHRSLVLKWVDVFFHLPLLAILAAVFLFSWRRSPGPDEVLETEKRLLRSALLLSLFLVLAIVFRFAYVIGLVGYVATLLFALTLGAPVAAFLRRRLPTVPRGLGIVLLALLILSLPAARAIRAIGWPNHHTAPLDVLRMTETVRQELRYLLVGASELVPVFLQDLNHTWRNPDALPETLWLFPHYGRDINSEQDVLWMQGVLSLLSETTEHEKVGWYLRQSHVGFDVESRRGCVWLWKAEEGLAFDLEEVILANEKHIFFVTSGHRLGCALEYPEGFNREVADFLFHQIHPENRPSSLEALITQDQPNAGRPLFPPTPGEEGQPQP